MGYGYGWTDSGRYALSCGGCGKTGGVRKRTCPYKVQDSGMRVPGGQRPAPIPYCPAPALCSDCYKKGGGLRGWHGDVCRIGAADSQAREDAIQARLEAGEMFPAAAWGDWHQDVPEGKVGVLYKGLGTEAYYLVSKESYEKRPALSEAEHEPWEGPQAA